METPLRTIPAPRFALLSYLQFRRQPLAFFQRLQRAGRLVLLSRTPTPILFLSHPKHIQYVLTENPQNFTSREAAPGMHMLAGDGLLTLDGETHRQQRRIVQPAFHRKQVERYATTMLQYTDEMLAGWAVGDELDLADAMRQLTLRIVARCLFSTDLAHEITLLASAFSTMIEQDPDVLEEWMHLRLDLPCTAFGRRMAAKRTVDTIIFRLIAERQASGEDRGDVLSLLLGADLGEEERARKQMHDHLLTFLLAGHETTASTLAWTFWLLSANPTVRARLQEELDTMLVGRRPTLEDLSALPYLEWVLLESMRLYPAAWVQGRRAVEAFELDGILFPPGTMLLFSQWVVHRLPEIWGDAEHFRPERFDPGRDEKVPAWSYFPFGGGPRVCIGMPFAQLEAKLLLIRILQKCVPLTRPGYHPEPQGRLALRMKKGLPVVLHDSLESGSLAPFPW